MQFRLLLRHSSPHFHLATPLLLPDLLSQWMLNISKWGRRKLQGGEGGGQVLPHLKRWQSSNRRRRTSSLHRIARYS